MGNSQKKTYQVEYEVKNEETINIGAGDSSLLWTLSKRRCIVSASVFLMNSWSEQPDTVKTSGVGNVKTPSLWWLQWLHGSIGNLVGNHSCLDRLEPRHEVYIKRYTGKGKPLTYHSQFDHTVLWFDFGWCQHSLSHRKRVLYWTN